MTLQCHNDSSLTNSCQSKFSNNNLIIQPVIDQSCCQETYLKNDDSIQIPPSFPIARAPLYTRYTPTNWWNFHQHQMKQTMEIVTNCQKTNSDDNDLVEQFDQLVWENQNNTSKEISNVQEEIRCWKNQLEDLRGKLINVNDFLDRRWREIESFQKQVRRRLQITQENLYEREKRHHIDLVYDDVEHELIVLIDILTDTQRSVNDQLSIPIQQRILSNRDVLQRLEREISDKSEALIQENAALHSKNTLPYYANISCISVNEQRNWTTTPINYIQWLNHLKNIVDETNCVLQLSMELFESGSKLFCFEENIRNQWEIVNCTLEKHIDELKYIRHQLQEKLTAVKENIFNTQKNMEYLRKSIHDKSSYSNVIQCRQTFLSLRPTCDDIQDREYPQLTHEWIDLQCVIETLNRSLSEEENNLQHLYRLKTTIEEDLARKNNSLFVDQEKVIGLRHPWPL